MVISKAEALTLLEVEEGASERQIRSQVFRKYQEVTAALSQLEDERQRPLLEAQLDRLNEARDLLLAAAEASSPTSGAEAPWYTPLEPSQYADLPSQIRVLIYQGAQEGIHTIKVGEVPVVVVFESAFGARKFAQQLAQKGFPKPVAELIYTDEIVEFCQASGYGMALVPETSTVEPLDTKTSTVDDWDLS